MLQGNLGLCAASTEAECCQYRGLQSARARACREAPPHGKALHLRKICPPRHRRRKLEGWGAARKTQHSQGPRASWPDEDAWQAEGGSQLWRLGFLSLPREQGEASRTLDLFKEPLDPIEHFICKRRCCLKIKLAGTAPPPSGLCKPWLVGGRMLSEPHHPGSGPPATRGLPSQARPSDTTPIIYSVTGHQGPPQAPLDAIPIICLGTGHEDHPRTL